MKLCGFKRPSVGFIALVAVWCSMVLFLVWGAQRPDLDVAWRAQQQVENSGQVENLTGEQLEAVRRVLEEHPALVEELDPRLVEAARDSTL